MSLVTLSLVLISLFLLTCQATSQFSQISRNSNILMFLDIWITFNTCQVYMSKFNLMGYSFNSLMRRTLNHLQSHNSRSLPRRQELQIRRLIRLLEITRLPLARKKRRKRKQLLPLLKLLLSHLLLLRLKLNLNKNSNRSQLNQKNQLLLPRKIFLI